MFAGTPQITKSYTAFCVYGGSGLGGLGLQWAKAKFGDDWGQFELLGSVDVDAQGCADFEMLTGVKATPLDLFDERQYQDWHGKAPSADWREATCEDLKRAAQNRYPRLVLITAPCKGLSGLLSQEKSDSVRYQALNLLTYRGVFMVLETWKDHPPDLILFENVPRISTRGKKFLNDIKRLLIAYGYTLDERHHDLGPIGGLGQHRKRYLLVARRLETVSSFLYYPPNLRMKSIGEVMEHQIPWMPDDAEAGPMHRLPRLQWKTWVRLALIPPGGNWRDLQKVAPGQYRIMPDPARHPMKYRIQEWDQAASTVLGQTDVQAGAALVADPRQPHLVEGESFPHKYEVAPYDEPAPTVTGSRFGSGASAIADPRGPSEGQQHANKYRVEDASEPAHTVTGSDRLGSGAPSVADYRIDETSDQYKNTYRVVDWEKPAGTVVSGMSPSNGAGVVADPRLGHTPMGGGKGAFWVQDSEDPSGTITADPSHRKSGGASCVADPRLSHEPRDASMRVGEWDKPGGPVIGNAAVTSSNGIGAVADPRLSAHGENYAGSPGLMGVNDWEDPSKAVTGSASVSGSNMAAAVADPRIPETPRFNNVQKVGDWEQAYGAVTAAGGTSNAAGVVTDPRYDREPRSGVLEVRDWEKPSGAVTGGKDPNGNMVSVADPRREYFGNMLHINDYSEPSNTVTGATGPNQAASLVADPRLSCAPRNGTMGVTDWNEPGTTVLGAGDVHTGTAAVADPRDHEGAELQRIPDDKERGVWWIRSPHKDKKGRHCVHRPMTTMELMALQSVPVVRPDGSPMVLAGNSDRAWRERIGNGLPPAAMKAIGEMCLLSLMPSEEGAWIMSPYGTPVWVRGSDGEIIPLDLSGD